MKYEIFRSQATDVDVRFLEPIKLAGKPRAISTRGGVLAPSLPFLTLLSCAGEKAVQERNEWRLHVHQRMTAMPPVDAYRELFAHPDVSVLW